MTDDELIDEIDNFERREDDLFADWQNEPEPDQLDLNEEEEEI